MSTETIEHTFSVNAPARLSLANMRGSVEITAGEADVMYIQAKKHLESGEAEHTRVLIRQAEDGRVSAETRFEGVNWFTLPTTKPCKVDYLVHIPRECDLQIKCVSSSLSVQGVSGTMNISTVSGALKLVDVTGSLQVKSVSGDISAEKVSAQLALETVSGDLLLTDSKLTRLEASTVSGDLFIQSLSSSSPVHLKSVSGDVALHVPEQTGLTIRSQSISGDVVTTLPVTQRQKSFGETRVIIGGGETPILHRSISGDLIIKGGGSVGSPASAAEQESQGRMDILERIERGEMSVEEALHSLQPESPLS